jgi:hypothetical protein
LYNGENLSREVNPVRLRNISLFIAVGTLVSVVGATAQECSTRLIVVEQDGRVSAGSREMLRAAVEAAVPLRVGWSLATGDDGKPALSHWADASFVTVFEGEVFAQVAEIRRQTPRRGERHVELSATPQRWTGSVGSDGVLEGAFDDDQKPTRTKVRVVMCADPRVPLENLPMAVRSPKR